MQIVEYLVGKKLNNGFSPNCETTILSYLCRRKIDYLKSKWADNIARQRRSLCKMHQLGVLASDIMCLDEIESIVSFVAVVRSIQRVCYQRTTMHF